MKRRIIRIDEDACCGCGACAAACHEGAIDMIDGKAKLTRESYCDGLGDCLPECPTGAITFEEREAPAYDEAAVLAAKHMKAHGAHDHAEGGCPGARVRMLRGGHEGDDPAAAPAPSVSRLTVWPCQIRLVPVHAPYFDGADLLIAADCTAYAYANFHDGFMKGRVTLIGCPKLDPVDYSEKLTEIMRQNRISGVTVVRMEVPCCGGLERAAKLACMNSERPIPIPFRVVTISTDGKIL